MNQASILYVDDDISLQTVVEQYLENEGCQHVYTAGSRAEMAEILKNNSIDVILLDLTLPDASGFEILTQLRPISDVSVIIVSGKTDTTERIIGIELGADDYLIKPFDLREMVARIKAVLRRRRNGTSTPAFQVSQDNMNSDQLVIYTQPPVFPHPLPLTPAISETNGAAQAATASIESAIPAFENTDAGTIIFGDNMVLDRNTFQVYDKHGKSLNFTTGEFRLLESLLLSKNRALSRERLFDLTREGKDVDFLPFDRAIDIQVSRIRKKLSDDRGESMLIRTVRGIGYMYCDKQDKRA